MNELKEDIYNHVLTLLPEMRELVDGSSVDAKEICLPFSFRGVFNSVFYDTRKCAFTRIEYTVGVGEASLIHGSSGYFDATEKRVINI